VTKSNDDKSHISQVDRVLSRMSSIGMHLLINSCNITSSDAIRPTFLYIEWHCNIHNITVNTRDPHMHKHCVVQALRHHLQVSARHGTTVLNRHVQLQAPFCTSLAINCQPMEKRSFAYAGPATGNSLAEHLQTSHPTLNSFKCSLKTNLYAQMTHRAH